VIRMVPGFDMHPISHPITPIFGLFRHSTSSFVEVSGRRTNVSYADRSIVRTTDFKYNQRLHITANRENGHPSIAVNAARAASATNTHDPLTTINSH
jgi:hypothetical protein